MCLCVATCQPVDCCSSVLALYKSNLACRSNTKRTSLKICKKKEVEDIEVV
jgi:hypothetical protein